MESRNEFGWFAANKSGPFSLNFWRLLITSLRQNRGRPRRANVLVMAYNKQWFCVKIGNILSLALQSYANQYFKMGQNKEILHPAEVHFRQFSYLCCPEIKPFGNIKTCSQI